MSLTDALAAKIAALRAGERIDWRVVVSVTDFVDRQQAASTGGEAGRG
jgi:hypothetical protein